MCDRTISRKELLGSLLSLSLLPAAAACRMSVGPQSGSADESAKVEEALRQKATIQFMSYIPPAFVQKAQDEWAPQFSVRYPHIRVEVIIGPGGIIDMEQKLQTMAAAGVPPDVYVNVRPASKFARLGLHTNLSPFIRRDRFDTRQFPEKVFEWFARYQGDVYGLPVYMHAESATLIYNRTLFQEAGLPEPPAQWGDPRWTWDAFVDAARRLTKAGPGGVPAQVGVDTLAYPVHLPAFWNATWVAPDLKTATCDTPAMIECYTAYADLPNRLHVMPRPEERPQMFGTTRPFFTQKVGMSTMGSWEFPTFQKLDTIDWAFMPWPKPVQAVSVQDPGMVYLPEGSKYKEQAWAFIKWMEEGQQFATNFGWMPVVEAEGVKWAREFFAARPNSRVAVLTESLRHAVPTDPIFAVPGVESFVRQSIEPAITRIFRGEAGAKETLQELKGPLQEALNQAWR